MKKNTFEEYLISREKLELLRFITCGSVDDGKSTLIGRMLNDINSIRKDELEALRAISKKSGTQKGNIDYALLLDGLTSEQEQGITIDVAYKYFSTEKRKFIVADTPGHEEYTRNMVTGSSVADLAVILIDVNKGISKQTLRHTNVCNFMGIKKIILAVNKMDLINYDMNTFLNIEKHYLSICKNLKFEAIQTIPVSAINGENISSKSKNMSWYKGPSIIDHLEKINISQNIENQFFLPIQLVNRPTSNFRGFSGLIASGNINKNEEIFVLPSGSKAKVKSILIGDKVKNNASFNENITLTLNKEISVSRGDLILSNINDVYVANQFEANIVWLSKDTGYVGREYILKLSTQTTAANITFIKYELDIENNKKLASKKATINNFYVVNLKTIKTIWFKKFHQNKTLGSFLLIDQLSNETVAGGTINHNLTRSTNLVYQNFLINKETRRIKNKHKSKVFWLTGLSGSGKSTIANFFEQFLHQKGVNSYILDGDNIRQGLNNDLGFTDEDRIENIRRVGEVAKLFVDAGIVTIVSFISPFKKDREMARRLFSTDEFVEVYVNTSLEVCEKRDVKGLYQKARAGLIPNFTGINSKYDIPSNPEITIDTEKKNLEEIIDLLYNYIK